MNVPNLIANRDISLYQRPPPITDMISLSKTGRCVIYARCSTERQEYSLDSQIDFCTKWLERNGLQVAGVYKDEGRTGTTDKGRKGLKALVADLKTPGREHEWDLIVAFRIDRYFRNARLFMEYQFDFLDHGVYMMSAQEDMLNRTDSMTQVFRFFTAHQAEAEAQKIGENVQRGKLTVARGAESGKWMGGSKPLGFDVVDGILMIDAKESVIIKKMYEWRGQGFSLQKVADMLNEAGYKSKKGRSFSLNSVRELIINPIYKGDFQYNRSAGRGINGKYNRHAYKSDDEIIHIKAPQLVSMELWQKVQPKPENKRKTASTRYLLSGMVTCSCGANMHTNKRTNHKKVYVSMFCPVNKKDKTCGIREIDMLKLEDYILTQLQDIIFSKKILKEYVDALPALNTRHQADLAGLRTQKRTLDKKIKKLLDNFESDCSIEAADKRLAERSKEREDVKKEIKRLEALIGSVPDADEISTAKAAFITFAKDNKNFEITRKLIFSLVEEITVGNDHITITFY